MHPAPETTSPETELRSPAEVMRLERMGSFFPTRLSFMRTLVRQLAAENTPIRRTVWKMDNHGYGRAAYTATLGGHPYSLVAFSTPLADADRSDRVIAQAWDSSYVLYDGIPSAADLDRLEGSAPLQEAARFDPRDLVLSRANRSMRLFDHVVERLAAGRQPDPDRIAAVGYLMRTTAVYGNGKFGIADRSRFCERPHMDHPFRAEMLTVFLIRGFTLDLVEHIAQQRSPATATTLDPARRRHLGIGNATGLGMSLFLTKHPILINNWMLARETALARVRAVQTCEPTTVRQVRTLITRVGAHLAQWHTEDARQMARITTLHAEWQAITSIVTRAWAERPFVFDRLVGLGEDRSLECQELLVALVLEPNGHLVDGLADCMSSTIQPRVDGAMPLAQLAALVQQHWSWATTLDFSQDPETARFWYVSAEKLEPRLGLRRQDAGAEREEPLDIARRVQSLAAALANVVNKPDPPTTVAEFVMAHPEHRDAVRRVQTQYHHPYAEIHDNLISERCLPIDMLRCKLSFFGASKFDPKSDRWTRITMFQGAPLPEDIGTGASTDQLDDWWLPVLP